MSTTTTQGTATRRNWWSLVGLCGVTALAWITASDISIALPAISADLGGSMDQLQWAVNGYFLAGALIIVGGRVGDLFGRRLVFAIGTLLIVAGSVIAGLAPSPMVLVLGRVIEGVGAAAILPTALAIVAVTFSGRQRETAIAAWIATCWGAQAVGPLVGGALVDSVGWRSLFWINIPLGLAALALTWRTTSESREQTDNRKVDIPGAVTIVLAVFFVSYALVNLDNQPTAVSAGVLLAAVLSLVAFILIERRVQSPVVVLSIFRQGRFDGATLSNLIANFVFGAAIFFMSLYLQVVEGYSALMAGALLLPATVPILILNPLGTWMGRRWGAAAPTAAGMVLLVAACALMTDLSGTYTELLLPFILLGAGIGLQITPCASVAVENPGEAGEGVASGIFKASSMIGGSLGVAVSTAVFQSGAADDVRRLLDNVLPDPQTIEKVLAVLSGGTPLDVIKSLIPGWDPREFITTVFDAAIGRAMWPSIIASVIGVVIAAVLLRGRSPEQAE